MVAKHTPKLGGAPPGRLQRAGANDARLRRAATVDLRAREAFSAATDLRACGGYPPPHAHDLRTHHPAAPVVPRTSYARRGHV